MNTIGPEPNGTRVRAAQRAQRTDAFAPPRGIARIAALAAVAGLWAVALAIEFAVQRWLPVLAALGDVHPLPSASLIEASRWHLPIAIAVAGTLALAVLASRRPNRSIAASIVALSVAAFGASLGLWALALPLDPCGLDASGNAPAGACGAVVEPPLREIDSVPVLTGLAERLRARVGQDFRLDTLPEGARELRTGLRHLMRGGASRTLRTMTRSWSPAYGARIQLDVDGQPVTALAWSPTADFSGRVVYALSDADGIAWPVFVDASSRPAR